jgi:glycosidase
MQTSVSNLDLSPIPGKVYFNLTREWREEFIYFLMVDRFHDDAARSPVSSSARSVGIQTLNDFYGGKIKGITQNLDYINGLGCTTIWLSPVFENNKHAYHGYDTANYLDIDPNFGTKQDLIDLVDAAHARDMRVVLDIVINHSGDNWYYPNDVDWNYFQNQQFPLGGWRRTDRPVPTELRDESLYHRRGRIQNYDSDPLQVEFGDISSLKDYANDDDRDGSQLIDILIKAHCYWIREADIDGFRVDAVKHMGALACARFSSGVREYAYSLGKRRFFLFGELAKSDDEIYDRYIGPNTSRQEGSETVFFGIDSLLDFRLAQGAGPGQEPLRDVIKGFTGPQTLFNRLNALQNRALNRGELGRYLVTFVDNHDGFWQPSGRFGTGAPDLQIVAAIGFLLCYLGTACIYYGTEQGVEGGAGGDDNGLRRALFDKATPGRNLLNPDCTIYKSIAAIAKVMREREPLRFGRMYFRPISTNEVQFGLPHGSSYTLAFSRLLYGREVLVAYNVSSIARNDRVVVDAGLHKVGETMTYLYPQAKGTTTVKKASDGTMFVRLDLDGYQFAILE